MENPIVVTGSTPELVSWLDGVRKIHSDYITENYTHLQPNVFTLEEGGKFIRVVTSGTTGSHRSVYCFIAKVDSTTKVLGTVKAGDVLKSASWKAPARHARGNIFDSSNGLAQCNSHGVNYR
jgi:hypothetical protein